MKTKTAHTLLQRPTPAELTITVTTDGSVDPTPTEQIHTPTLVLPYQGPHGLSLVRRLQTCLRKHLASNVKPRVVYKCKKVSAYFSLKDKIAESKNYNLVYQYQCATDGCGSTYVGETCRRLEVRIQDHKRDANSNIYKHSVNCVHPVSDSGFRVLGSGTGVHRGAGLQSVYLLKTIPLS